MYGLTVITGPTQEPVTLAEARAQCRVDHVLEDAKIAGYIVAARELVEGMTGRALAVQTFELTLDDFPRWTIHLPRAPVTSITSIAYTDSAGSPQTVAAGDYLLDASQLIARITPAYGKAWPASRGDAGNVKVRFVAGEAQPPESLRLAVRLKVESLYDGGDRPDLERAIETFVSKYRLHLL